MPCSVVIFTEIRLENISKSFGRKMVLQPMTLTLADGAFTTLLGPSGCGKATLLRMLAGLETPDSGEIYFDDTCVFSQAQGINLPPERRALGFVFQDFALWPHMTVFENVAFGLRASGRTANLKERVSAALKAVQLGGFEGRYPQQLSGGQQQRVAFARAIVIEPKCILFDEPLSALDALLREEMRAELKALTARLGITAVFVTHDQIEAMSMSDKIAVLNGGRVEQYDTPENVYAHPASAFVARFVGASNWLDQAHMFRPERASLRAAPGAQEFIATVCGTQFLGGAWQLLLRCESEDWRMSSDRPLAPGTQVPVYINKEAILTLH